MSDDLSREVIKYVISVGGRALSRDISCCTSEYRNLERQIQDHRRECQMVREKERNHTSKSSGPSLFVRAICFRCAARSLKTSLISQFFSPQFANCFGLFAYNTKYQTPKPCGLHCFQSHAKLNRITIVIVFAFGDKAVNFHLFS